MDPDVKYPGHLTARSRAALSTVISLLLLAGAPGCVTKHSVKPDALDVGGDSDIHVYLKGRRMIEFDGGSYSSVDSIGTRYLYGNGIDYRPDSTDVRIPFSGYLPFSAIDRIETRKVDFYSALYVSLFIGFFAVIGFATDLTD